MVKGFLCPSDQTLQPVAGRAPGNYVGCAGMGTTGDATNADGVFYVNSQTRLTDISDGTTHTLGPGGLARVDAPVHRAIKNVGETDATYVVVGAKGGYVGRDGREPE